MYGNSIVTVFLVLQVKHRTMNMIIYCSKFTSIYYWKNYIFEKKNCLEKHRVLKLIVRFFYPYLFLLLKGKCKCMKKKLKHKTTKLIVRCSMFIAIFYWRKNLYLWKHLFWKTLNIMIYSMFSTTFFFIYWLFSVYLLNYQ